MGDGLWLPFPLGMFFSLEREDGHCVQHWHDNARVARQLEEGRAALSATIVRFSHTTASVRQPQRTEWAEIPVWKSESSVALVSVRGIATWVLGLLSSKCSTLLGRAMRGTPVTVGRPICISARWWAVPDSGEQTGKV